VVKKLSATAICENASYFLTNDKRFPHIPNVELLILDDLLEQRS